MARRYKGRVSLVGLLAAVLVFMVPQAAQATNDPYAYSPYSTSGSYYSGGSYFGGYWHII